MAWLTHVNRKQYSAVKNNKPKVPNCKSTKKCRQAWAKRREDGTGVVTSPVADTKSFGVVAEPKPFG